MQQNENQNQNPDEQKREERREELPGQPRVGREDHPAQRPEKRDEDTRDPQR
jgi:hypothetical protein